jgi:ferredoxin
MYRIEIDRTLCSGLGVCAELAPKIVTVGPTSLAELRTTLTDDPAVLEAAESCPMAAITVVVEDAA